MKNNIYFKQEVNDGALKYLPKNIVDLYNVEFYNPSLGCIRTLNNKIVAIYFYVSSNIHQDTIIKFNYINEEMNFDSIYLRKEKEYRFDKYNNLIASYDFYDSSHDLFCVQNKKEGNKSYKRFKEPQPANDILKEISKIYLTKEITDELIPAFHTSENDQEIYWLIE